MGMLIDPLMDVCHSFVDNDYLWTPSIYFDLDSLASYEMVISVGGSFGNWMQRLISLHLNDDCLLEEGTCTTFVVLWALPFIFPL